MGETGKDRELFLDQTKETWQLNKGEILDWLLEQEKTISGKTKEISLNKVCSVVNSNILRLISWF